MYVTDIKKICQEICQNYHLTKVEFLEWRKYLTFTSQWKKTIHDTHEEMILYAAAFLCEQKSISASDKPLFLNRLTLEHFLANPRHKEILLRKVRKVKNGLCLTSEEVLPGKSRALDIAKYLEVSETTIRRIIISGGHQYSSNTYYDQNEIMDLYVKYRMSIKKNRANCGRKKSVG